MKMIIKISTSDFETTESFGKSSIAAKINISTNEKMVHLVS